MSEVEFSANGDSGGPLLNRGEAILILIIAVVGLGNIWRFPALVTQHGGGAFVLVYLAAVLLMAGPLLVAELKLGRLCRSELWGGLASLTGHLGLSRAWMLMPLLWWLAGAALLAVYGVLAGWSVGYVVRAASGQTGQLDPHQAQQLFLALAGDPERGLAWLTIFWVMVGIASALGLHNGVLRSARVIGVLAGLLLLILLWRAETPGDWLRGLERVLQPDFSALGFTGLMEALCQAAFTLSLGLGMGYVLGRHLSLGASPFVIGSAVIVLDLLFSLVIAVLLLACLEPQRALADGVRLLFVELVGTPGLSALHVPLFVLAALFSAGSALVVMEPLVDRLACLPGVARPTAAATVAMGMWLLGLLVLVSFGAWQHWQPFGRSPVYWLQYAAAQLLLPLNLLLLATLVGRALPPSLLATTGNSRMSSLLIWHLLLRYPTRLGLIAVLVYGSGLSGLMREFWSG